MDLDPTDEEPGRLYEGKLVIDKTRGHVTYGCGGCCCKNNAWMELNPLGGGTGFEFQETGYTTSTCNPTPVIANFVNWFSFNTSIATVSGGLVHGIALGSTLLSAGTNVYAEDPGYCCTKEYWTDQATVHVAPKFNVAYSSYIPVDHVLGPTSCTYQSSSFTKIYMGDGGRGTYRTTESIWIAPDLQQSSGFFQATGETRNYGAGSPANGSILSAADEDNVALDCLLWNQADHAIPAFSHDESYPYAHQGQVHYSGSASNPLESPAPITWDMRTVIDDTNPLSPTAYVIYNHTCYPAHQIKVNGAVVYLYTPPQNDIFFVTNRLFFQRDKVIGQTSPTSVPPQ